MDPTMSDVLSGRGAWFNQHPGNKHFRRMLEEQKVRVPQHFPPVQLNVMDEYYRLSIWSMVTIHIYVVEIIQMTAQW